MKLSIGHYCVFEQYPKYRIFSCVESISVQNFGYLQQHYFCYAIAFALLSGVISVGLYLIRRPVKNRGHVNDKWLEMLESVRSGYARFHFCFFVENLIVIWGVIELWVYSAHLKSPDFVAACGKGDVSFCVSVSNLQLISVFTGSFMINVHFLVSIADEPGDNTSYSPSKLVFLSFFLVLRFGRL